MTVKLKSKNLRESKIKWLLRHRDPMSHVCLGRQKQKFVPGDVEVTPGIYGWSSSPPQGVTLV